MADEAVRRFPEEYSILEPRAIATRALAESNDYSRALLREQLEAEEFAEVGRPAGAAKKSHPARGASVAPRAAPLRSAGDCPNGVMTSRRAGPEEVGLRNRPTR